MLLFALAFLQMPATGLVEIDLDSESQAARRIVVDVSRGPCARPIAS